jgi:hypothetical protein
MLLILVPLTRHHSALDRPTSCRPVIRSKGQAAVPITTVHDLIDHERTKPLIRPLQ